MKKCYVCLEVKPSEEYYKDIRSKDTLSSKCKSCSKSFKAKNFRNKTEKRCPRCELTLSIEHFDFNTVGDGYQSYCKACRSVAQKVSNYDITKEEYLELVSSQGGHCAICGEVSVLVVDHCHNTNKVRGLLCHPCNLGLGHFKDETDRLLAAAKYLG